MTPTKKKTPPRGASEAASSTTAGPDPEAGASPRPPYLWAAVAGLAVFALYAITLARTTAFWDASEYIATAHMMGIPHPPGNPLFVVLARAWSVILEPFGFSVAVRVNLFSAFMSAAAHGLWFLVVHHILRFFSEDRIFRLGGAATAVLISATAFTVWNQSNVNEKVYTISLLTIALLSWLIIRWQERLGRGGDDNLLVLMAFILALSVGNHLMAFLAAPAIGIFILLVNPRVLLNWKLYPTVVVAALLGLSIHLFLPIRAELDPLINEGAPECAELSGAIVSVATWGAAGCEPLSSSLNREQYKVEGAPGPGLTGERQAPVGSQFVNYLQYFDWQWARSISGKDELFAPLRILFTMLFTGLAVWGALEHRRRDPKSFWYMATLLGTLSIGLVWYLNFRYGYSMPGAASFDQQEVRERDYFFIVSFSLWGLWAGVGLAALWQHFSEKAGSWARGAPILALALIPLGLNWSWADRSYDHAARDWAHNLLMSVEPYGVIFTNGDNDTFPLWYLQEVEGLRRDVQVVVTSYLNTGWYAKQVRDLTTPCAPGQDPLEDPTRIVCQRPYEGNTEAVYTHDPAALPEGKIAIPLDEPVTPPEVGTLVLEDETIDRVEGVGIPLDGPRVVPLGPIDATISGGMVAPWQQFALAIIANSLGDRPIYFSSGGAAARQLGLDGLLVRQGLAYRLLATDPATTEGILPMPEDSQFTQVTGRWLDVDRTRLLLNEVFVHHGGIPEWGHWPDHATFGIPNYYAWAYWAMAQAALIQGDEEALARYRELAERWTILGNS